MSEAVLRVRKKGVTILPKKIREKAGIAEESEVRVQVLNNGILLRPLTTDPVSTLENLPTRRKGSTATSIRKLRRKIDLELRGKT